MIATTFVCWLLAIITVALFGVLDKANRTSASSSRARASVDANPTSMPALWLVYGEYCENYNTPIEPVSPHNAVSDIVRENGVFSVTIENSITKEKKTLCNKDKWNLCQEADDVAFKFALKERDEYHTI